MARPSVSSHQHSVLTGWSWASTPPGSDAPPASSTLWHALPADVAATTVAAARRAEGTWTDDQPGDIDGEDHWFRCTLPAPPGPVGPSPTRTVLRFDGLATIATVWLNGREILSAQSMFVPQEVDISSAGEDGGELLIRFASLTTWLKSTKRPRPRWKTRLVDEQHLRWARTALLGRISSWGPRAPVVGPWRPVAVEHRAAVDVSSCEARSTVADLAADGSTGTGTIDVALHLRALDAAHPITGATLTVGPHAAPLHVATADDGTVALTGSCTGTVELWWPHTHGTPALHQTSITLHTAADDGGAPLTIDLGRTGFRTLTVDRGTDGDGFGLVINGRPVFCRGAVWMPIDPVGHQAPEARVAQQLRTMADGGMNMVRLSGTTVYETAVFHHACDELGILVWQDLMLANLDVPFTDPVVRAQIDAEIAALMDRLQLSPSLAVVCGSSELDQQATMMGVPTADVAGSPLHTHLPGLVGHWRHDVAVVPSSPFGGHLPFVVDAGVGHYYGVGAYQRPLTDARHAGIRFTSECLAFANVPTPATTATVLGSGGGPTHPRWKAGVPRDAGAGWDFEDVRDHYVRMLFDVDPAAVRYADPQRYFTLGRAAAAHVMGTTMAEWRRPASSCRGALVWFLNDLANGPGWGLLETSGRPKAAFHGLARSLAPQALLAVDEGVNGLHLWAVNDRPEGVAGTIEVVMIRNGRTAVVSGSTQVEVAGRSAVRLHADDVIGRFTDPTYAYRFGTPGHDAVVATWTTDTGTFIDSAFHFPLGLASAPSDLGLSATAVDRDGVIELTVTSRELARFVTIDAGGAIASHEHFHLAPGASRTVQLHLPAGTTRPARGFVSALNAAGEVGFSIPAPGDGGSS